MGRGPTGMIGYRSMNGRQRKGATLLCTIIFYSLLQLTLTGCERPDPDVTVIGSTAAPEISGMTTNGSTNNSGRFLPPTPLIHNTTTPWPTYLGTPTPDPTRPSTFSGGVNYDVHVVSFGETLSQIAQAYETTVEELVTINELSDSDLLAIGQQILVPAGQVLVSPSFKLIPDSELVYGPAAKGFDAQLIAASYGGYLLTYQDDVEGQILTGPEIVHLVANRQFVNPRLLLALLEYESGWVMHPTAVDDSYPLGYVKTGYEGLYQQLTWAANRANLGYYGRSEGGRQTFELANGTQINFAPDINDGTAGVQLLLASFPSANYDSWLVDVGPDGFYATYNSLFGNPFAYTVDPLWPADLTQPALRLPWIAGETWFFTGGPHGGWANGSAWAALDFAPQHDQLGCYASDAWVTAMIDGTVTRSDFGGVIVDTDGDGYAGTGWAIYYLHLESRDRVPVGTIVEAGDRLGHPSCEGGFSNGTHLHVARTYNGRWVSADGSIPFVMSGWTSQGLGQEYDGLLVRGDVVKEACECREEGNAITAD